MESALGLETPVLVGIRRRSIQQDGQIEMKATLEGSIQQDGQIEMKATLEGHRRMGRCCALPSHSQAFQGAACCNWPVPDPSPSLFSRGTDMCSC
eukprot:CAMPEP_0175928754 /NCGR_PEP_ID=MMETSP0108-20121206/17414_1 /TAXON_ID=195067 ORGANISM="Goniomonas pacifica, Strain CCMP1869" /NCGR_SAMPLE_ID=MMETSP0108 /ASSEMBLY_ACC=CAM_ASM_000204 /LENGTH=94 /DNA_ID=CAMNT_0017252125 /DNA_START=746 /DNA_END=1027 /DNA_ORIENTATION=-